MRLIWLTFILALALPVQAQQTCEAAIQAAYASTALECADLIPGEVCYGSGPLNLSALTSGDFERPGDRIRGLQRLESSSGSIAITQFQVNEPEQLVTLVVLGEVTLENLSEAQELIPTLSARVSFAAGAILRAEPDAESEQLAALRSGQVIPATGRLEDGSWFRLLLDNGTSGWVRADLILVEGDLDTLPIVTADDEAPDSLLGPMQVLQFSSGDSGSDCRSVPPGGLLLQTDSPITLYVNEAELSFDGTVFLQSDTALTVSVLESSAELSAANIRQSAIAGQRLRAPITEDGLSAPREAELYLYVEMQTLPLDLLPRPLESIPFNTYGLVTPAAPGQDPLADLTSEDVCTVEAVNEVRLRQGPGVEFGVPASLQPGERANPDARAAGTDGLLWWRLAQGVWVRSDVVLVAGTCGELPVIEAPPLPTAVPTESA